MAELLTSAQVRELVPMTDAIGAVRDAFRDLAAGHFTLPHRLVLGGTVLVMSAHHEPSDTTVVKTISVRLDRTPAILGTVVWSSPSGQLVADAEAVTTLRTGAVVGVATDALTDLHASRLAMIGTGSQAADQVRAVHAVRPLTRLAVFGRNRRRAADLRARLADELAAEIVVADTVEAALAGAQIVCCATSALTPLFAVEALGEHVHVNAIGSFRPSMRELPDNLLASADLLVVDQVVATMNEAGEIIHALDSGSITRAGLLELGHVIGTRPARNGRTVFKTVGIGVQDWAIARLLSERAGVIQAYRAGEPPMTTKAAPVRR